MIVVVFRSRLDPAAGEDYEATNARMEVLAVDMPTSHTSRSLPPTVSA
jgi:hypothetical protein